MSSSPPSDNHPKHLKHQVNPQDYGRSAKRDAHVSVHEAEYQLRKDAKAGEVQLQRHDEAAFSQGARAHERKDHEQHKDGHGSYGAPGSAKEDIQAVMKRSGGSAEAAARAAEELGE